MKLFVVSDSHAFHPHRLPDKVSNPSYLDLSLSGINEDANPIRSLIRYVIKNKITADALVFCGDLADRADPIALAYVWRELHNLKTALSASHLIATAGNHDLDSRYRHNDFDAKGHLLELSPGFPFQDENENNHYWAQHFNFVEYPPETTRFIVINSAAYHGNGEAEFRHGRISSRTQKKITEKLERDGPRLLNIAVCHHHPYKHAQINSADYDHLEGGEQFLQSLNPVSFGPWLILHGHRHVPNISYAHGGGGSAAVVFSAGSCAAIQPPENSGRVRNQAYIIDASGGPIGSSCKGTFMAFDWLPSEGWSKATLNGGLPERGGFGYRGTVSDIGQVVVDKFPTGLTWKQLSNEFSDLKHIIPSEIKLLGEFFQKSGYHVEWTAGGTISTIEK